MHLERQIKPIFEFLLWDNCSNNCQFCFLKKDPRIFSLSQQEKIATQVMAFMKSEQFIENSHILLVGGELFDDARRDFLIELFKFIDSEIRNAAVDNFYLNTNLIYDSACLELLQKCLKCLDKNAIADKLHFTTSYDICGRFSCQNKLDLFLNNIKQVKRSFPNMTINTNMILTRQMCEAILDKTFNATKFENEYDIVINFLPYIILNDDIAPSRELVLKTLLHLNAESPQIMQRIVSNTLLKQKRIMYYYKDDTWNYCSCEESECGHSQNFRLYDRQKIHCFACDLEMFLKNVGLI